MTTATTPPPDYPPAAPVELRPFDTGGVWEHVPDTTATIPATVADAVLPATGSSTLTLLVYGVVGLLIGFAASAGARR